MWQNSPDSSRSLWVRELKLFMRPSISSEQGADLEAETEILGHPSSPSDESASDPESSDIPLNLAGELDEPDLSSRDDVGSLVILLQVSHGLRSWPNLVLQNAGFNPTQTILRPAIARVNFGMIPLALWKPQAMSLRLWLTSLRLAALSLQGLWLMYLMGSGMWKAMLLLQRQSLIPRSIKTSVKKNTCSKRLWVHNATVNRFGS